MIVHAIELRIPVIHPLNHIPFNHHESSRTIKHLCEPILNSSVLVLKVHHERARNLLDRASVIRSDTSNRLIPHDALLGVHGNAHIMTATNQPNNRLGIKVNVRVNKHKVVTVSLFQKTGNRDIPGSVNQ
jgi:hypothetical protein